MTKKKTSFRDDTIPTMFCIKKNINKQKETKQIDARLLWYAFPSLKLKTFCDIHI